MQKCMKYMNKLIKNHYMPLSKLIPQFDYTAKKETSPENSLELSKISHPRNTSLWYCSNNKRNWEYQVTHLNWLNLDRTAVGGTNSLDGKQERFCIFKGPGFHNQSYTENLVLYCRSKGNLLQPQSEEVRPCSLNAFIWCPQQERFLSWAQFPISL